MLFLPLAVKFGVMAILSTGWLAMHRHMNDLPQNQPFHLAAAKRDARKGRFYFLSVWVGLLAAFFCFGSLEALGSVSFDSTQARDWVLGLVGGLGLWGILISAAVWARVGQRASMPNADGMSLTPLPEEKYPHGRQ